MKSNPLLSVGPAGETVSRWDLAIEWLLAVLLAFTPLALGVISESSELAVLALVALMSGALLVRTLLGSGLVRLVWYWSYLPLALFVLLVALQLVPLPLALLRAVSPQTAALKLPLLADLAQGVTHLPISFNPVETARGLRLVFALAMVYVIITQVYRTPRQIRRLLITLTLVGGGVALLALVQDVLGNGKIFWTINANDGARSGPFVNHSHYGQYMNLGIGAALGLLLVKLHEQISDGHRVTIVEILPRMFEPGLRGTWICAAAIALGAATIFASLTRAGMLALLIAGAFTIMILAVRRGLQGRNWVITLITLLAFICVLYVGFDAVYNRLATLSDMEQAEGGRWEVLSAITTAWTQFKLFGTGLNSHDVVYPMFDYSSQPILSGHADVEYAQIAEETGGVGLALILLLVATAWWGYHRAIWQAGRSRSGIPILIGAFGLGFGLLAVMIQSVSDYGQRLPAIGLLTTVTCALLATLGRMAATWTRGQAAGAPDRAPGKCPVVTLLVLLPLLAVWLWVFPGAIAAMRAQQHWDQVLQLEKRLADTNWMGDNADFAELIGQAQRAVQYQPDQVRYQYWLNAYRWYAISRVFDPETGELVMTGASLEHTRKIVAELLAARVHCPTFGALYSLAGQLQYFILSEPAGSEAITRGYELAPCDPTCCFVAGQLDGVEGRVEAALEKFRHTLALNGSFIDDVLTVVMVDMDRPDLAVELAAGEIGWLSRAAVLLSELEGQEALVEQARGRVVELLKEEAGQPHVKAPTLASLGMVYRRQENHEAAADCLKRALVLDYSQVGWHLALAQSLAQLGQAEEAIHAARICLRLKPNLAEAKKLIESLSVQPQRP